MYKITNTEMETLERLHRHLEIFLEYDEADEDDKHYYEEGLINVDFEILEGLIKNKEEL